MAIHLRTPGPLSISCHAAHVVRVVPNTKDGYAYSHCINACWTCKPAGPISGPSYSKHCSSLAPSAVQDSNRNRTPLTLRCAMCDVCVHDSFCVNNVTPRIKQIIAAKRLTFPPQQRPPTTSTSEGQIYKDGNDALANARTLYPRRKNAAVSSSPSLTPIAAPSSSLNSPKL